MAKFIEKQLCWISFLIKLLAWDCNFIKKQTKGFLCQFSKNFRKHLFQRTPPSNFLSFTLCRKDWKSGYSFKYNHYKSRRKYQNKLQWSDRLWKNTPNCVTKSQQKGMKAWFFQDLLCHAINRSEKRISFR